MEEEFLFKITIDGAEKGVKSFADIAAASKALREERKNLDLTTDASKKRLAEINTALDLNNTKIKESSSALEKQRMNIGNYTGALDKLVPGLGATVSGFQGMTKSALAFIATPIGVVIGTLGLAVAALTQYFKGSEEGQDRWNKILNVGGVIMEKITDLVELVGKKVYEILGPAFTFVGDIISGVAEAIGVDTKAVSDFFDEIDARAELFSKDEKKRNEQERELTVLRAKTARDVAELIIKSQESEGQAKLTAFNQAIKLQKDLLDKEKEFAETKLRLARLAVEDDPTIANKQKEAEAIAGVFQAEASFNEGIKKLNGQRVALEVQLAADLARIRDGTLSDELRRHAEELASFNQTEEIKLRAVSNTMQKKIEAAAGAALKVRTLQLKESAEHQNAEKTKTKVAELEASNRLATTAAALGMAAGLFARDSIAYKVLAISRATMDTYRAADLALASAPPPVNFFEMAAVIGVGLGNVLQISKAAGGGSFMTKGPTMLIVGDNPGGVERVDVTPVSGRGKTVVHGPNLVQMGGGGSLTASGFSVREAARQSEELLRNSDMLRSISQMKTYLSFVDFKREEGRYTQVVDNASL